jgi:hypothetical protein
VQLLNKASKIITSQSPINKVTLPGENPLLQNLQNLRSRTTDSQANSIINNFSYAAIHIGLMRIVGMFHSHPSVTHCITG